MNERDDFLEQLRGDARALRYEPSDPAAFTRIAARVRGRIAARPTVASVLLGWFRPVTAALLLVVAASAAATATVASRETSATSISTTADLQLLAEDFYSVGE